MQEENGSDGDYGDDDGDSDNSGEDEGAILASEGTGTGVVAQIPESPVRSSDKPRGAVKLVATHNYKRTEDEDLGFSKGDILWGYELQEMWWRGTNVDGTEEGMFPANRVREIESTPARPARTSSSSQRDIGTPAAPQLEDSLPLPNSSSALVVSAPEAEKDAGSGENDGQRESLYSTRPNEDAKLHQSIIQAVEEQKVSLPLYMTLRALECLLYMISFICTSSSGGEFYSRFASIKFVIAMGVLAWMYTGLAAALRLMEWREVGNPKVYLHPKRHRFFLAADVFFLFMNLIAAINCGAANYYPSTKVPFDKDCACVNGSAVATNVRFEDAYHPSHPNSAVGAGVIFLMFAIFLHLGSFIKNLCDQVILQFVVSVTQSLKEAEEDDRPTMTIAQVRKDRFSEWVPDEGTNGESAV